MTDNKAECARRHLFVDGEFIAHSGGTLQMKIECDALTDESIDALAKKIARTVPAFGAVHGIPRGGLRLAAALRPLSHMSGPTLIVDDVLTTGASMEEARKSFGGEVIGVVIFARGPWADWITPLWCDPKAVPGVKKKNPVSRS